MSDYIPDTEVVRRAFIDGNMEHSYITESEANADFDRWLNQERARIWAEGFDAGEKDVWQHEHVEDGWDADCIKNPYLDGEPKKYPLPLPPKTAKNTEPAPLSRPMKFKEEKK